MRSAVLFASAAIAIVGFPIGTLAQTIQQIPATPSQLTVDIAEQPDCPLRLSLDAPPLRPPSFTVKLVNTGDKPIEAFVLIVDADRGKQIHTTIRPVKMIGTETSVFENAGIFKEGKFTLSIDYVEFADGTTWGADQFGRSKYINAYLTGRNLAITRLKDLLGGNIPDDFQKLLDAFGSYSLAEPANANRPDLSKRQTLQGYREVISMLRRSTKRTEEAQDLARKLELMENTLG